MDEIKKIKLSFIIETDIRYGGGTEKTILFYYKYMDKNLFDIKIFQTNIIDKERISQKDIENIYGLKDYKRFFYPGIINNLLKDKNKGLSYQGRNISKDIFLFYSIFLKYLFSRTLNRKTFIDLMNSDIIYIVSDYQLFYLFFPRKLLSKKKPILIFGTHNYLPIERRTFNKFENAILKKMVYAIHFTSSTILNLSKIRRNTDFVISSGVDTRLFFPEKNAHEKTRYLFVGRLVEYKGIKELLEAWSIFKYKSNTELHIVGTGELEDLVIEKSKSIENIIYHGFVSEEELPLIYRNCDIFVFPTYGIRHDEYFGLVVIEALASGEYVILSDGMKGIFDYFEKNNALEYVSVNPEKISERMEYTFENISKLKENVLNVRKYIEENYDWKSISENLSKKIYEIYNKMN